MASSMRDTPSARGYRRFDSGDVSDHADTGVHEGQVDTTNRCLHRLDIRRIVEDGGEVASPKVPGSVSPGHRQSQACRPGVLPGAGLRAGGDYPQVARPSAVTNSDPEARVPGLMPAPESCPVADAGAARVTKASEGVREESGVAAQSAAGRSTTMDKQLRRSLALPPDDRPTTEAGSQHRDHH